MRLLRALDRRRRVTAVPFQQAGVPAAHGLTVAECEAAAWAVAPDGARYRGAGAVSLSLAVALGFALPVRVYRVAGIRWLADRLYDLVARARSRLPGDRPYCDQHPDQCR